MGKAKPLTTDRKLTPTTLSAAIRAAQIAVPCPNLAATLDFFTDYLGFRVDVIFPADAPETAVISGYGVTLRLETATDGAAFLPALRLLCDVSALPLGTARELVAPNGLRVALVDANPPLFVPDGAPEFVISRQDDKAAWGLGRAGMEYRDLLPGRLGGRFVASHIRILEGGPVPDYVHFHKVRFQMIYCKTGWARLVYEDQGPPFVLAAGDCVLQPPEIRHRVLEASAGLEVIEIGCPALHETRADHELQLPNARLAPKRLFSGQRFVRHIARAAVWQTAAGFAFRDTGIADATNGLARARIIRAVAPPTPVTLTHMGEFLFLFILRGELAINSQTHGTHQLLAGDSCALSAGLAYAVQANANLEMLEVALPSQTQTEGSF